MHVLRFYIPYIANITFDKHGLGAKFFIMQRFERRNKESKNTFRRFTNGKGNVGVHTMNRLQDMHHKETNAY